MLYLANLLKRSGNVVIGKRLGLSTIAWSLLGLLGHHGPMTQTEIVERYLIDKGQLSRAAVTLAKQRLIHRERRTWRSIELRLAPQGRRRFSTIERILREREKKLVAGVDPRDLKALYRALAVVKANASALLSQE